MVVSRRALIGALCVVTLSCRRRTGSPLMVFAAASTSEALGELGRLHGEGVRFSFGASGDLARQIEAGAPADVFLSADTAKMDRLEKGGHVARRHALLRNRLVVVVPTDSKLATLGELVNVRRLAIGDPAAVPAGAYAKELLTREGLYEKLAQKIVPTLDVRAALTAVETGAADAAIVYRTDVRVARGVRVALEPVEQPDIVYPIAVLSRATGDDAARFVDLARSDRGRAVFERHGFSAA